MSLYEEFTTVRQACTIHASEFQRADAEAERPGQIEQIVERDGDSYDQSLTGLDSVHPSQDVNTISCECRQECHVQVVQRAYR